MEDKELVQLKETLTYQKLNELRKAEARHQRSARHIERVKRSIARRDFLNQQPLEQDLERYQKVFQSSGADIIRHKEELKSISRMKRCEVRHG